MSGPCLTYRPTPTPSVSPCTVPGVLSDPDLEHIALGSDLCSKATYSDTGITSLGLGLLNCKTGLRMSPSKVFCLLGGICTRFSILYPTALFWTEILSHYYGTLSLTGPRSHEVFLISPRLLHCYLYTEPTYHGEALCSEAQRTPYALQVTLLPSVGKPTALLHSGHMA